jgi:hypothetical protein
MAQIDFRRLSAWAGILAPVIFVAIFTLEGAVRPGYDPARMYISALSLGPRGWVQIANFMALGLLLFGFAFGLSKEMPSGKASRGGIVALYVLSVLFFISGPFVMDPVDTPPAKLSGHGLIHGLSGGIVFLLMPITIFIFLRRIWTDQEWETIRLWTLILCVVEALGVIAFTAVSKLPADQNAYAGWLGLFQRVALIPFILWLFIFSVALLKKQK